MKKYLKDIPELVKEYDFEKNKDVDFNKLTHSSAKVVWWKCYKGHKWRSKVYYRTKDRISSCVYCSGKKACKDNCLTTTHPELAKEWSKKNKLKPEKVTYGSAKKVWWECSVGHKWKVSICDRTKSNTGCPICCGRFNDGVFVTHANLKYIWDYSLNKLDYKKVTAGSHKKAWWKCNHCKKSYLSPIKRVSAGHRCPYCSGKKVLKEKSFSNIFPNISKEWNYKKNKLKPTEVTYGSKKKVWWKCKKCYWEWESTVLGRKYGSGCPRCNESKGEKLVSQVLDQLQVRYKREYKFKELGNYRFDFALFRKYKRKPYAIIEYHGTQHYQVVDFSGKNKIRAENQFKKIKFNDKIKKQYCLDNNIKYLEISYKEKDNIEKIIKDFIE